MDLMEESIARPATMAERLRGGMEACPYFMEYSEKCDASFGKIQVDALKIERSCLSEDYDACPFFVSKQLRGYWK